MGLYQKYRPTKLEDVIGQPQAISAIQAYLEKGVFPPTTLFYGPSGTGKDTLARIVCKSLGCPKGPDRSQINAADDRGIDTIRTIRDKMNIAPLTGKYRVWIFSEVQQWTSAAQSALLEMFEDTPDHVKFMMTTTDPQKLQKAIKTRSFQVKLRALTEDELLQVLKTVCKKAELTEKDNILKEIANKSEGSARMAVQTLDDIKGLKTDEEKLKLIKSRDVEGWSRTLAQLLMSSNPRWCDVAEQLRGKTNEEAENIRLGVMAYARAVLLGENAKIETRQRAAQILKSFESLYDSGLSKLSCYCWDVVNS